MHKASGAAGLRLKTSDELRTAWVELFHIRRRDQPDDTRVVTDKTAKARLFITWMNEWLADNLRVHQAKRPRHRHIRLLRVYLKQSYGCTYFVMALLETGFGWSPSLQRMRSGHLIAT